MSMGIIMKGFNALYFKSIVDFIFEFIPQIIFLIALFGWMDILIIAKWCYPKDIETDFLPYVDKKDFTNDLVENGHYNATHYSPPIITTMIDMFLGGASNSTTNSATG